MGMAEIVQTHIVKIRLGPELPPEAVQPVAVPRAVSLPYRENPAAVSLQPLENRPGRLGQSDGPGAGLAVAEEQVPVAVVRPPEGQDLVLAAPRQQKQTDHRHRERLAIRTIRQCHAETAHLPVRQEALAPLPAVAPDAPTGG